MPGVSVGGDAAVSSGQDAIDVGGLSATSARWSVPIDDTHTLHIRTRYVPAGLDISDRPYVGQRSGGARSAPYVIKPYREYLEQGYENPELGYTIPRKPGQEDVLMLDAMGPIVHREDEHLGVGDEGLRMVRGIYLDDIERVKRGEDPRFTIRDEAKNQMIVVASDYHWISEEEFNELPVGV